MAVTIIGGGGGTKGSAFASRYSFGGTTDAELVQLIADADAETIDLVKDCGWQVGDRRSIGNFVLSLWNKGGVKLSDDSECHFVVGLENCCTSQAMHSSNMGSWRDSDMRTYCNGTFRNSIIPSGIRTIFKQFKCVTYDYNSNAVVTTLDYFALPAAKEVFGVAANGNASEAAQLVPFSIFNNLQSRIRQTTQTAGTSQGDGTLWWLRSPRSSADFCLVYYNGAAGVDNAANSRGVLPFGCI